MGQPLTTDLLIVALSITTRALIFLRPGFVNDDLTALQFRVVQRVHRGLGFFGVRHLHEPESFTPIRHAIHYDADAVDLAIRRERLTEIILRGVVGQLAYIDVNYQQILFPICNRQYLR